MRYLEPIMPSLFAYFHRNTSTTRRHTPEKSCLACGRNVKRIPPFSVLFSFGLTVSPFFFYKGSRCWWISLLRLPELCIECCLRCHSVVQDLNNGMSQGTGFAAVNLLGGRLLFVSKFFLLNSQFREGGAEIASLLPPRVLVLVLCCMVYPLEEVCVPEKVRY